MKVAAIYALGLLVTACGDSNQDAAVVDTTLPEKKAVTSGEAKPPTATNSASCGGYWGRFGKSDAEVGMSVEVKTDGTFEILFGDYGTSSGTFAGDGGNIEMTDRENQIVFELTGCASGAPSFIIPADEYSGKKRFTLERFETGYWSEAEKRGIPIPAEGGE